MKLLLIAYAAFCLTLTADLRAEDSVMIYRYWDWGMTPQRDDYQIAVLTLALEKTVNTHGKYQIIRRTEILSQARVQREIARGHLLNIHAAPITSAGTDTETGTDTEKAPYQNAPSILVHTPLMKGLLGYRSLIIRRSDYQKFSKITEASELKRLTAGQGHGWVDAGIYRYNGYGVKGDPEYFTLFALLAARRIDYLPLSVIEAEDALARSKQAAELMIMPELMLYYALPTLFYVSARHPELAERLEQGLILANKDGSIDNLFEQHFSKDLHYIRSENIRIFVLKNPAVASELGLDKPLLLK